MITGKSGAAQVGRLAPRHIDLANTDVNDRPGQAWMRVDLRTTWRRTRPGKSDERGRAWTIRILLRIRRLGVRVPPSAPLFPQVTAPAPQQPDRRPQHLAGFWPPANCASSTTPPLSPAAVS